MNNLLMEQYCYAVLELPFRGKQDHDTGIMIGVTYPFQSEELCLGVIEKYVSFADRLLHQEVPDSRRYLQRMDSRCLTYPEWKRMFARVHDDTLALQRSMQFLLCEQRDDVDRFTSYYTEDIACYLRFIFEECPMIGKSFFFSPLRLSLPPRLFHKHCHLVAKTGAGKSTMLRFLWHNLQLHSRKKKSTAMVMIDPHADLARSLKKLRINKDDKRLVYVDPALGKKQGLTPVINPFDIPKSLKNDADFLNLYTTELVEALQVLLDDASLTRQMTTVLEPMIYTLLRMDGADMQTLKRFVQDDRNEDLVAFGKSSPNSNQADFFQHRFSHPSYDITKQALYTRLQSLLNNEAFAAMVCGKSSIDIDACIRQGKVLVFALSRPDLGKSGMEVMCRLVLTMVQTSIVRNGKLPPTFRKKVFLFVDEFQMFANSLFMDLLEGGRKFGLSLIISHQTIGQLDSAKLLDSVLGNCDIRLIGRSSEKTLKAMAAETTIKLERLHELDDNSFELKVGKKNSLEVRVPKAFATHNRYVLSALQEATLDRWLLEHSEYYVPVATNTPNMFDSFDNSGNSGNTHDVPKPEAPTNTPPVDKPSQNNQATTASRSGKKRNKKGDTHRPSAPPKFNF